MRYCSLISHFKGKRQSVYFAWKRSLMSNLLCFCWGQAELCYLQNTETAEVVCSYCSLPLAISLPCTGIKSYEWSPAACLHLWQLPLCWASAPIHSPAFPPMAVFPAFGCPGRPWGITSVVKPGNAPGPEGRGSCSFMTSQALPNHALWHKHRHTASGWAGQLDWWRANL